MPSNRGRSFIYADSGLDGAVSGRAALWSLRFSAGPPAGSQVNVNYGLVYAAINDIVAPGLRGTAMAGYLLVTYLGGAAFGPLLTGMLSDRLARRAAGVAPVSEAARAVGLHQAMYLIPAMAVVLAAVLWMGARSARRYSVVQT